MSWSKNWCKKIELRCNENDKKGWIDFPLQFANIYRVEKNDAVYILDETGGGKTISTGLMAIHYLYNNPDKKVLVITIPSLIRSRQFENDWFNVLPFDEEMKGRITFINDTYSNISKYKDEAIGLLVVDEAHRHLEAEKRRESLKSLKAEKIIFMTATPIKRGAYDLENYCELADVILGKTVDRSWVKEVKNDPGKICSKFDREYPVTRYFKDTINALKPENGEIDFEKKKDIAIRKIPEIWCYRNDDTKTEDLFGWILKKAKGNRFIIFTRYIEKEADKLVGYLNDHKESFTEFHDGIKKSDDRLSYVSINGGSSKALGAYSHSGVEKELPDILIVTYQIAEAGVNLPGYNYVVNYHIPAFPSALEQRFGRIDRIGMAMYENIHMAFLISGPGSIDTYKLNFFLASFMYSNCLLSYIPARNTILTKDIMEWKKNEADEVVKQIEELKLLCADIDKVSEVLDRLIKQEKDNNFEPDYADDIWSLVEFCDYHEINADSPENLQEEISMELEKIQKEISSADESVDVELSEGDTSVSVDDALEKLADKIFYNTCNDAVKEKKLILRTMDPIRDCAKQIYDGNYKDYIEEFNEDIKVPLYLLNEKRLLLKELSYSGFTDKEKDYYITTFFDALIKNRDRELSECEREILKNNLCWLKKAEEYFESQFMYSKEGEDGKAVHAGYFRNIFTDDYKKLLKDSIFREEISEGLEGIDEFIEDFEKYRELLPFFIMCREYKKWINLYAYINCNESLRDNPFTRAYMELKNEGLIPEKIEIPVLMDENGYYSGIKFEDGFFAHEIKLKEDDGYIWTCGNWFKLGFQCWYSEEMEELIKYINDPDVSEEDIGEKHSEWNQLYKFFYTDSVYHNKRNVFRILYGYDSVNEKYNYSKASDWIPYEERGRGYGNLKYYENEIRWQLVDIWSACIFRMLIENSPCENKPFGSPEWKEEFRKDKEKIQSYTNKE